MKTYNLLAAAAAIASLYWSVGAHAAPTGITICTGGDGGPYNQIGLEIARNLGNSIAVNVVADTGGTWGNIERSTSLGNKSPTDADYQSGAACNAFIGQPDGLSALKRRNPAAAAELVKVGTLHTEYLHALCNKASGYDDIGQLGGHTDVKLAVGENGSGAYLVWDNFVYEDSSYKDVPTVPLSGMDAVAAVANGDATCMLVPAGVPNKTVMDADELFGDQLVLAGVNDKDFNDATDVDGKPLYEYSKIPSGSYPKNLQGWWSSKSTISWKAGFWVNTQRIDPKLKSKLITAVARTRPWAQATFGGGQ